MHVLFFCLSFLSFLLYLNVLHHKGNLVIRFNINFYIGLHFHAVFLKKLENSFDSRFSLFVSDNSICARIAGDEQILMYVFLLWTNV
jgi:hypothetical protein